MTATHDKKKRVDGLDVRAGGGGRTMNQRFQDFMVDLQGGEFLRRKTY